MNIKSIKEQFLKFLEENECKNEYFKNNLEQLGNHHWTRSFNFLLYLNPESLIQDAFKWCETDEGNDFWSELNNEWYSIYYNYLDNNKIYYKLDEIWSD